MPDLNIIAGLPSVSGYASIVNGNYESVTHTHEQDDLDIGQLASGTLDRLDLREVVTLPEYFLVPLQSTPTSVGDIRQLSEGFGADAVLPRGYGADYNETAYPFYPGPRPTLRTGQTASWFFGESLQPDAVTLLLTHAAGPGTVVRFGALARGRADPLGRPGARGRGVAERDGAAPGRQCGRRIGPCASPAPSRRTWGS